MTDIEALTSLATRLEQAGPESQAHKGRIVHVRATGQAEEVEVEYVRTTACQCKPYRRYICPACLRAAIAGKENNP